MHLLAGLDSVLELAFVGHGERRARLDAPFGGVARGVDEPGEARRHKMLVLVRFQHIQRFFVGERGVVDVLDAVPHALNDRAGRAGVGGEHKASRLGFPHGHRDLFLRHRRFLGFHAGDFLAREIELDGIDAVFDQRAHGAADFLGA